MENTAVFNEISGMHEKDLSVQCATVSKWALQVLHILKRVKSGPSETGGGAGGSNNLLKFVDFCKLKRL